MRFVARGIEGVGEGAIKIAQEVGGIVLLTGQVIAAFVPPRILMGQPFQRLRRCRRFRLRANPSLRK